jgi:hypothetical protein
MTLSLQLRRLSLSSRYLFSQPPPTMLTAMSTLRLNDDQPTKDGVKPAGPTPSFPSVITLDIGGRLFKASTDILIAESGLFQRQLPGRFTWTPQADGSYFLDADPEIFEHLLRFMRRPGSCPLFWSKERGFDYDMYRRLQDEAEYFQVDTLYHWIKDKEYKKAVTIYVHPVKVVEATHVPGVFLAATLSESRHFVTKTRQSYVCPRELPEHRGAPGRCGKFCHSIQGGDEDKYEAEDYTEMITVREEIMFKQSACKITQE